MEKITNILNMLKQAIDERDANRWKEGIRLLADISKKDLSVFMEKPSGSWGEFIVHILSNEDQFSFDVLKALHMMKEFSVLNDLKMAYSKTSNKHIKKEIRRIFHRWRTLGLNDAVVEESESVREDSSKQHPEGVEAWMSLPDYSGNKHVFLIIPIPNAYILIQGIVNDIDGISKFSCIELSSRDYKKVKMSIEKMDEMIFSVEPEYAGYEIREGFRKNPNSKEKFHFSKYESVIPILKIQKSDFFREILQKIDTSEQDLYKSNTLLDKKEFKGFFADAKFLEPYVEKLLSLEESRIIVSIHIREEQQNEIFYDAISNFPEELCFLYKERLCDIGLFYLKKGLYDDLRKVIAVIKAVDERRKLSTIPFFIEGIKRAIILLKDQKSVKKGNSSIIINRDFY